MSIVDVEKPLISKERILRSGIALWIFIALQISSTGQQSQIDPFYMNILEKAQKSFLSRSYEEAIRYFEISAFGFAGDKMLKAKAYVYLSLSYFYLKNVKESEKYLRQAADLMSEKGFEDLQIYESAWPDLNKLITFFNIRPAQTVAVTREVAPPLKENIETAKRAEEKTPAEEAKKNTVNGPAKTIDIIKEGDIVPLELVDTPPQVLKSVEPVYPPSARGQKIEGVVIVNALINEKGNVIKSDIIKGMKGAFGFNQASQRAVRAWKFSPASVKGIKVKVWMPVAVQFKATE